MHRRVWAFCGFLLAAIPFVTVAREQGESQPTANRPPIAAPVKIIPVTPLPIVRSQTEALEDLVSGLVPGLMVGERGVQGVAFAAIRSDHVVVRKDFGFPDVESPFEAGSLSEVLLAIATMQQIEQSKLSPGAPLSSVLGETAPAITADQLLSHQGGGDPALLARVVEAVSGEPIVTYLPAHIFASLKMMQSTFTGNQFRTSVADVAQLMMALLNDGSLGDGHILKPATVQLMERTHAMVHPELPGWSYGFAEDRRNGWRALQHDSDMPGLQARLVLVPEAKLGYFIVLRGHAGAEFWRLLDDTVFNRTFATQAASPQPDVPEGAAPGLEDARLVAGAYQPGSAASARIASLKIAGQRLNVSAADDGSLVLSGAVNSVLAPKEGGYWSGERGTLNGVFRDGRLVLTLGIFEPMPVWLRWEFYFWVGLALMFALAVAISMGGRGRRVRGHPDNTLLGVGTAAGGLLLLAFLIWLLAPAT